MFNFITRRQLLIRASTTLAGALFAVRRRSVGARQDPVSVYYLTPFYDEDSDTDHCGGCSACTACINHGANKIFAKSQAADNGRAHDNCDCQITEDELPFKTFVALFGHPQRLRRQSVDKRWPWVQAILQ